MAARPLRDRLARVVLAVVVGAVAAMGLLVHGAMARALEGNLDLALAVLAATELASAVDEPGGAVHLHEPPLGTAPGYEKLVHIEDRSGRVVAATANLGGARLPLDARTRAGAWAGEPAYQDVDRAGEPLRALARPLTGQGPFLLVVAVSRRPMLDAMASLQRVLVLVAGLALAASMLASRRLAAQLALPLEQIAAAARHVEAGAGLRMPVTGSDREVDALAASIDGMLERLDAAFAAERHLTEIQQRFVADASHELRTPLANLRSSIDVTLRRDRTAPEYRAALDTCRAEVERMTRLVDALLTLGRADAGHLDLRRLRCDLAALARQSVGAFAGSAAANGVTLAVVGVPEAQVEGDPDRLRQVLDNLVDNAVRHSAPGGAVTVTVGAEPGAVVVRVDDQGPGLSPALRDKLFERFARAEESRTRAAGGAGLGLAIARALVEAQGGTVVALEPARGASFEVRVPVRGSVV